MNKKNFFRTVAVAALAVFTMSACQDSTKMDDKPSASAPAKGATGALKIAYVEVDSLMTQYTFCKEYQKILEKRQQNVQNTLATQQRNLEAAAQNFQNKLQNNGFTSREEAEKQQANLQHQDQQLQASAQRLQSELLSQTDKFNQALRDSIQHFLVQYNKDKKYSLILTKQGDNILYADKSFDITAEVVAGLNKAYKSKPLDK